LGVVRVAIPQELSPPSRTGVYWCNRRPTGSMDRLSHLGLPANAPTACMRTDRHECAPGTSPGTETAGHFDNSASLAWPPPRPSFAAAFAMSMIPRNDHRYTADWTAARDEDNARRLKTEKRWTKEEESVRRRVGALMRQLSAVESFTRPAPFRCRTLAIC
jgi:hypothetical protein